MLHYGMSQPVAVVITGIDKPEILDQALKAVRTYKPMTTDEQKSLLAKSAQAGVSGAAELYKVSQNFDSTTQHPEWLDQA